MASIRFNAPHGLSVGQNPVNSIDASNAATFASLGVTGASTLASLSASSLTVSGTATFSTIPTAPTPTLNDNTTKLATTAWVFGQVANTNPVMDGAATQGVATRWARADHRHPSDTSRLTVANPSGTGKLTLTGGTVTTSNPIINLTQTWNNAGVTFNGFSFVVTDTASSAESKVMHLQIGSNSFGINKTGSIVQALASSNLSRDVVGITGSRHVREYQDLNDYNVTQNIGGTTSGTESFEWGFTWNGKWDGAQYVKDRANAGDHAVMFRVDKKFRQQWHFSDGSTANSPITWVKKIDFDFPANIYTFNGGLVANTLSVSGNFAVNTNKFNITAASGNTTIAGTLGVTGNFAINTNKFNVTAASGNTTIAGTLGVTGASTFSSTLGVTGNLTIGASKLVVTAASGNTTIAGTLGVTGATTLSSTLAVTGAGTFSSTLGVTGNFTVGASKLVVTAASGNTTIAGTLGATGNFAINTNKFNVTAASGNTTIAGTLGVTGASTFSSTLGVTGNFSVNTNKFNITAASGNTTIAGTLGVTGATTLSSTLAVTGAGTFSSTLGVTGNFTVGASKLVVTAASGNTTIAGTLNVAGISTLGVTSVSSLTATSSVTFQSTLGVTGNLTVGSSAFVITASNGNVTTGVWNATPITTSKGGTGLTTIGTANQLLMSTGSELGYRSFTSSDSSISFDYSTPGLVDVKLVGTIPGNVYFDGDLSVGGSSPNHKFLVLAASGNTDIKGTLSLTGNFAINTNKFNITATSGNTTIAGTLGVTGKTTATEVSTTQVSWNNGTSDLAFSKLTTITVASGTGNLVTLPASARSAEILIRASVSSSGAAQTIKLLAVSDNATGVAVTEFGNVEIGDSGVLYNVTAASGVMTVTATVTASTDFKVLVTAIA